MSGSGALMPARKLVLFAAGLTLLAALWGGWLRLGWQFPQIQPNLQLSHGPLMVAGFLGTLIALERAVALGRKAAYLAPAVNGLGALLMVFNLPALWGLPPALPPLLMTLGSLGMVLNFVYILRQHRQPYLIVMALGAGALLVGNLLWITGWPVYHLVLWWAGFLILTVAGERLELGRLKPPGHWAERLFFVLTGLFILGLVTLLPAPGPGTRLAGLGLLGLALWLLRYDIARHTIRRPGLPRYAAVCLLSGYVWLAAAGVLALLFGALPPGMRYDAFLHSIFLGFTFSMIFGHAPIIFPAVLNRPVRFTRLFYIHLVLLHASLLARFGAGLLADFPLRMWSGLFNGIALLIFIALTAYSILARQTAEEGPTAAARVAASEKAARSTRAAPTSHS